jgi:hypothetical protein
VQSLASIVSSNESPDSSSHIKILVSIEIIGRKRILLIIGIALSAKSPINFERPRKSNLISSLKRI